MLLDISRMQKSFGNTMPAYYCLCLLGMDSYIEHGVL